LLPSAVAEVPLWVLDTNVLVSGLLSSVGPPARLVDAVLGQRLWLVLDDRIEEEYGRVLRRPKFAIDPVRLEALTALFAWQERVVAGVRRGKRALHEEDEKFMEVAAVSRDRILISGNLRHFPVACWGGVEVLSPLAGWRRLQGLVG